VSVAGLVLALTGFALYGGLQSVIPNEVIRVMVWIMIMFIVFIAALSWENWMNRGESDEGEGNSKPRVKRPLFRVTIGGMLMLMTLVAIFCWLHLTVSNEAIRLVLMIAISLLLFIAALGWERWMKRDSSGRQV
jgi:hypothetical protein